MEWEYWGDSKIIPCPFCGKKMERAQADLNFVFRGMDDLISAAKSYDTSRGGKLTMQNCKNCKKTFFSRLAPDAEAFRRGDSFYQWSTGHESQTPVHQKLQQQKVTKQKEYYNLKEELKLKMGAFNDILDAFNETIFGKIFLGLIVSVIPAFVVFVFSGNTSWFFPILLVSFLIYSGFQISKKISEKGKLDKKGRKDNIRSKSTPL